MQDVTCKTCGKVFVYPSQLKDHEIKHSGKRPFICGECGMDFMKVRARPVHVHFAQNIFVQIVIKLCNKSILQCSLL